MSETKNAAPEAAPQQQAQGEPEAVAWMDPVSGLSWLVERTTIAPGEKFIAMQSHREAIAAKDAELDECRRAAEAMTAAQFTLLNEIAELRAVLGKCVSLLDRLPWNEGYADEIDAAITHANQVLEGGGK